ncbi:hypothetical protein ACRDNQ_03195 [Palleronia sp. KMU-117]|uniref:hypothetical protein n=1 Tax=Palleronia sp. KMU-117 TaxID=3434108 RepID=UPI003D74680F
MSGSTEFTIAFSPPLSARLDRYFAEMGQGVNAHRLIRDRRDILLWLNARSDAELARMGLTRDGIPAHVFGDLFG